jgi:3-hydroxyisobutyrate dehydrogenase
MTAIRSAPVGFIGLGAMGEPMALNLVKAGTPLLVWNRTPAKSAILGKAGATVAKDAAEVFARCEVILFMLVDGAAMDGVLGRETRTFAERVKGRTLINMATPPPEYSKALEREVRAAGGWFVEAPVSGSRKPAETGQLVAMLGGEPDVVDRIRPLLAPMCRAVIACGAVPNGLYMKLAVNVFLTAVVTGLAEAAHFAERHGLDLAQFVSAIDAGPLASDVSRVKGAKLVAHDFAPQASIANVQENVRLIAAAARDAGIASPLTDVALALYGETKALGHSNEDMIAVIRAIEERTAKRR